MNPEARHELSLLEALEQDGRVTQRRLAAKLGMALGLTNIYLKRLVRKGCIKCVNVRPNRLRYLVTPAGFTEKARLTREFISFSLVLYREARQHLRDALDGHACGRRVAIFGTGEAAELTYLTLRERGTEPVAIFAAAAATFLGQPTRPLNEHALIPYDYMVVATLDRPDETVKNLVAAGVPREKLIELRPRARRSGSTNRRTTPET